MWCAGRREGVLGRLRKVQALDEVAVEANVKGCAVR